MPDHYDAIIIGTGAGGGTLALHLAQAGKRILIVERGTFLPQEKLNWDTSAIFLDNRYHTKDVWLDKDQQPSAPIPNNPSSTSSAKPTTSTTSTSSTPASSPAAVQSTHPLPSSPTPSA